MPVRKYAAALALAGLPMVLPGRAAAQAALPTEGLPWGFDSVDRYSGRVFGSLEWRPVEAVALSLDALTEKHEGYRTETSRRRIGSTMRAT